MKTTTRFALALVLLFFAAISVIQAQPYDDGGLRDHLRSPTCSVPCFMGIRPEVTTREEALSLLRAHPWVDNLYLPDDQTINWTWNGSQPKFLRSNRNFAQVLTRDGIVSWIGVVTSASLADFKIGFGVPEMSYHASWQARDSLKNTYFYFEEHVVYAPLEAAFSAICPLTTLEFWTGTVMIGLPPAPDYSSLLTPTHRAFAPLPENCQ